MSGRLIEALAGLATGLVLGLAYFGGLMATARRLTGGGGPVVVVLSLLLRLAITGAVLVLLARRSPTSMLAAVAALLVVRIAVTRAPVLDRWFPQAHDAPVTDIPRSEHG